MKRNIIKSLLMLVIVTLGIIFTAGVSYAAEEPIGSIADSEPLVISMADEGGYLAGNIGYSDMNSLINSLKGGEVLCFDNVSCAGFMLSAPHRLTGTLTLTEGNLTVDAACEMKGLDLSVEQGTVRIKSGELSVSDSTVCSKTSHAISMDYSALGRLYIRGGEIKSELGNALYLTRGIAELSGGKLSSQTGAAVYNSTNLSLSGTLTFSDSYYDIISEVPIHLSVGEAPFSSGIKVKMNKSFERGTHSEVFLDAQGIDTAQIALYGINDAPIEFDFFQSSVYSDELNYFAVHLPFVAKMYIGSEEYTRIEFLGTEQLKEPPKPEKYGYAFSGWYSDASFETRYDFTKSERADINLYANFTLSIPEYKIYSLSFDYDGRIHYLAFESLTHPLAGDGSFSYEWYREEVRLGTNTPELPISSAADSGSYKCKVSFTYGADFVSVITAPISVNVSKATVELPTISSVKYNGILQNITIGADSRYTVVSEGGINVGKYPVVLTLTDPENYCFANTSAQSTSLYFEITKCENAFTSSIIAEDCFIGSAPKISYAVRFGTPQIYYSLSPDGDFSTQCPSSAGDYYLKLSVAPTENYYGVSSAALPFSVHEEKITGITLITNPTQLEYPAFSRVDLSGAVIEANYNSGRRSVLSHGMLGISYKNGKHLLVQDKSVAITYLDFSIPLLVTVKPCEYDLSSLSFPNKSCVFSGQRHTIEPTGSIVGLDGVPLGFRIVGGGVDVGEYEVYLEFISDSINYITPASIKRSLKITPLSVRAVYDVPDFVYDGTPKLPSGYIENVRGVRLPLTLSGAARGAGDYIASAELPDKNYIIENPTVAFTVRRATLELSGLKWSLDEAVYTGEAYTVELSGLPEGVSALGFVDASAVLVGEYTTYATLSYDESNYNAPPEIYHTWRIIPAEYDMSGLSFEAGRYTYDGMAHRPIMQGRLPIGADGSSPSVSYSLLPVDFTDGSVEIEIIFTSNSPNYNSPKSMISSVTINKADIRVVWDIRRYVYDGTKKCPTALAAECELEITGGGVAAGEHIAKCTPKNINYNVINSSVSFSIEKCKNSWLEQPAIVGGYLGDKLMPSASSAYGAVKFSYYTDIEALYTASAPLGAGKYYMIAYVPEGDNYKELKSSPIPFEVLPILPAELIVNIKREDFLTLSAISSEDIELNVKNNNGSVNVLKLSDVTLIYKNGSMLSMGDDSVTIEYKGLSYVLALTVIKRDYDMSGVKWEGTEHIYDAGEKTALLTGLPSGIEILEYSNNKATAAGEYSLGATLKYDEINYNAPEVPSGTMLIKKAQIKLPELSSYPYDRTQKTHTVPDTELYSGGSAAGTESGRYPITLTLKDSANYEFEGGEGIVYLVIEKRAITLEVKGNDGDYNILSGSVLAGDELGVNSYIKDGYVYLSIQNPNYELIQVPLKYNDGPEAWLIILLIILAILLLALCVITLKYRRRIAPVFLAFGTRVFKRTRAAEEHSGNTNGGVAPEELKLLSVDEGYADTAISDALARSFIKHTDEKIKSDGTKKISINIGTISAAYDSGERVDINSLKEKGLIASDALYVKVLGGGVVDKPLKIYADNFSLGAVKMITLTGGEVYQCRTQKLPKTKI